MMSLERCKRNIANNAVYGAPVIDESDYFEEWKGGREEISPVAIVKIIDQDTGMLVSQEQVVKPIREEKHFFDGLITTEYQFDIRFMNTRQCVTEDKK